MRQGWFSPDPEMRYQASIATTEDVKMIWPRGCWGSANGWLMLVGPSPGRQATDTDIWPGGPDRPIDSIACIGAAAGIVNFATNSARNARWNMLSHAVFGNEAHANALTTVTNLDWGHNPDHKKIRDEYLVEGSKIVYTIMQEAKPRVVITLVRRTWDVFTVFLKKKMQPLDYAPATDLDCIVIQIPGFSVSTIVIRSPQHPSRHFFNYDHCAKIQKEVQHFLQT